MGLSRANGAPGLRPQFSDRYCAADVLDPDGCSLEICFKPWLYDVAGRAGLLLRVTSNRPAPRRPPGQDPANHFAFAAGTGDWTRHEVTADIPPDANYIFFGAFLNGRGRIELRNPQLEPHPASQQQADQDRTSSNGRLGSDQR